MTKNNEGLVRFVEKAYREKWGYVWGTFGQKLTNTVLNQKLKQYPSGVGKHITFIRNNNLNKKTADCVGLIKAYMWEKSNGSIVYTPSSDVSANGMYSKASKKGKIGSIPEIQGLCVWRSGHIGVYIGNGWVIEEMGTRQGIRKTKLKDRNFTHWLECPFISYKKGGTSSMKNIKFESTGSDVTRLQNNLKYFGYDAGKSDGHAGEKTISALKEFQRLNGLKHDGVYGTATHLFMSQELEKSKRPKPNQDVNNQDIIKQIENLLKKIK